MDATINFCIRFIVENYLHNENSYAFSLFVYSSTYLQLIFGTRDSYSTDLQKIVKPHLSILVLTLHTKIII